MEYGPPPSRLQIDVPAGLTEQPVAWLVSLGAALLLGLLAWRLRARPARAMPFATLALTLAASAPALGMLNTAVWGAYPTTDKQGSLLYYLQGVHLAWLDPLHMGEHPGVRLIGVHLGHLWVTAVFDLFLSVPGAFAAQGLLWLWLATWACQVWLVEVGAKPWRALALAIPFGLGLHLFRDLNWYTIEKVAVFVIPLYALFWWRTVRGRPWAGLLGALTVLLASLLNLYSGLLLGFSAGLATLAWLVGHRHGEVALATGLRRLGAHYAATLAMVAPLVLLQASLMEGSSAGATPECFLWGRAAHDDVTLWPLAWNRLELWRACELWALALAGVGLWRRRDAGSAWLLTIGLGAFTVSLGPEVLTLPNPIYLALWHGVPFFWRIAKPESFFFVTWLCLLTLAARGLPERAHARLLLPLAMVSWLVSVRAHPVFPAFTEYREANLAPPRPPDCEAILEERAREVRARKPTSQSE